MRVLVVGALGFIGRYIVAALQAQGHTVVAAVRVARRGELGTGIEFLPCDLAQDVDPAVWLTRLVGIDAVVNAGGLLKADAAQMDAVHHLAPLALARAAAEVGVRRLVQVSALGDPRDGEFVASKHRGDQALLGCALPVTVLRPSLVYALNGSYGGSSLLRALAAAPLAIPVPGRGRQLIQPVHARDLATLVLAALQSDAGDSCILPVVGPEQLSLADFLRRLRLWLRLPTAPVLPIPMALLRIAGHLGDRYSDGPLGSTMVRMLDRGNVATLADHANLLSQLGHAPQRLDFWLSQEPSQVQDRWHARLYPLQAPLRWGLGLTCLLSAVAGFAQSPAAISALAQPLHLADPVDWILGYGGSTVDAVLGAMLLGNYRARLAADLLLWLVIAYSVVLGLAMPGLWLDPWGALAKNLTIVPAILIWRVLSDRR